MGSVSDHHLVDEEISRIIDELPLPGASGHELRAQMRAATTGGKRFRPRLVLESFRAFASSSPVPDSLWRVAAGYEILHAAFVVHDDIIDQDTHRRGRLNVRGDLAHQAHSAGEEEAASTRIGDAGALLVGDLLLYAASRTILTADAEAPVRARLAAHLDAALAVSAAGEWEDATRAGADRDAALGMTANKTAVYSFTAPLCAGAALAGADEDAEQTLRAVAHELGVAFQLADDLIGAFGTDAQAGRESGADLREGKRTPLVALAQESADWPEVEGALALANTGPVAVRRAQRMLERSGARDRTVVLLRGHLERARAQAAQLPVGIVMLVEDVAAEIEGRVP